MELFQLLGTILISNTAANSAIDETTGRAENSESKMSKAFKKVGTAVAGAFAVDKIVNFGKAAIDTTASFEDGMLKVQSLSGATQEEYEKLSKAALDYGSTTAWSAKDVSDAMGYMALAGFDTNQILESTSGMLSLASASGEDLATVTDILTDSMTGFGDSADQASRYADVLATTQAKSNTSVGDLGEAFKYVSSLAGTYSYSLEDVSAALGTMANAGVKGSMAGTSLSSIITRLGTNTSGARDAIEKLGVSFYNQDGTARNLGDVLKDLCDATEDMDVAQKAEFASTVAGAEAQKGLLAILNQGSDAYENLQGKLYDCSGAASDMASNMESGLGGSIRSLQSAWEGFQIKLGEKIEPGVSAGLSKLTEFIQNKAMPAIDAISDGMSSILDWMKEHEKAVKAVAGALEVAAAAMVAFKAGAAIQSVIKSFQEAKLAIALFSMSTEGATVAQGLLNGTLTIGEGIVALLTGKMTLAQLAQAGMAKGQAALNAVMSANPIGIVIALIVALVAAFVVLWNKSEGFRNFWISIWDGMKEFAALAVDGIKAAVETLKQVFDSIPEKLGAVKDSATEKFGAIKDSISEKLETTKGAITEKLEAIKNDTSQKLNAIKQAYDSHGGGIKGAMSAALEGVKQIAKTGYDGLNTLTGGKLGDVANTFKNKLSNLKQTTQDAFEKVKSTVKSGIDKIKGFFNFNWKLPKIKLPHFSISGKFSLDPPSIPSFGVEWYKQGGIMTKPTAFGINPMTGNTMIGGEAGAEAIAPIDKLKQYIQEAISEVTPDEPKNIQNNFTFNSPKAINAKEAARLFKKQLTNIQLGY